MKRVKQFLMLLAGVIMFACSGGEEESVGGDNGGATPNQPETETPVTVEKLPAGVELVDGTTQLNSVHIEHIKSVDTDNSTLTFSTNLPTEQIPQKGDILLKFSATEELPYGFLGRVTEIVTVGDVIVVKTEAPALHEAFSKLEIGYDMSNIQSKSRVGINDNVNIDENNYLRFTRTLEMEDIDLECELSLGVKISSNIHIDDSKNIDNQQYCFGMQAGAVINYSPSIEGEYSNVRDFGDGILFRLPYASPAIMGAIQFSWVSEANGSISSTHTITATANRQFYITKNGTTTQTSNGDEGEASMSVEYKSDLQLEGELFSALGLRMDLRLFGRKELSVGMGTEIGPRASAAININSEDTNLYDALKDECVTLQGLLKTKAYAQAKLFGFDSDWSKELGDGWIFWGASRYIFPEFKDSTVDISNGKAECSTTVKRDLLFKSEIGIGQYDADGNRIEVKGSQPYKYEADFSNPLTASFTHKENHSYWTFLKWGNKIIKCNKCKGWSIEGKWVLLKDEFVDLSDYGLYEYIDGIHQYHKTTNGEVEQGAKGGEPIIWTFTNEYCELKHGWFGYDGNYKTYGYFFNELECEVGVYYFPGEEPARVHKIEFINDDTIILRWIPDGSHYRGLILQRLQ